MCTYVETPDVHILLDAGVSLCPNRFGLPPHPEEFKAIERCRRKIANAAEKAEVVTLSHYHFDHHTPSYEDWLCNWTEAIETARQIYDGKIVLIKNPKDKINYNQRRRGWIFQKTGGRYAKRLEIADGKTFVFGRETVVRFSEPVFHGPDGSALGWVLMTTIEYGGEVFLFAPDVQGPTCKHTLQILNMEKPRMVLIGGPPLYLVNFKVDAEQVETGLRNLVTVAANVPCVILEHHVLRDEDWRRKTRDAYDKAREVGHRILTAAEFLGEENVFLEAYRKRLYVENPPSKEFERWMKERSKAKASVRPPI
jgi:hypothetical protein